MESAFEVDGQESREKFKKADQLFREGNFREALALLDELNAAHPDTRNILTPMALCLERLGRGDEALPLCERLVRQFADARARALLERLRLPRALPEIHVDTLIDDHKYAGDYALPDLGPVTTVPVPAQSEDEPSHWPLTVLCTLCMAAIIALLALPLFSGTPPAGVTGETSAMSGEATGVFLGFALLGFLYSVAAGTLNAILALGAVGKLPSNTLGGLALDVGGTILVLNLIFAVLNLLSLNARSVPISLLVTTTELGILGYAFHRNYRLGLGNLAAFMVIFLILTCVLVVLPVLALVGVAGILAFFTG